MHAIHRDTFKSSITLQILRLNYNMLTGWDENVFKYLSNLSDLNLAQNRIAIFNKTSVPMDILNNLETFDLEYNSFNCSCDMIWLQSENPMVYCNLTACAETLFVFCFSLTISMQMPTIKNYIYYLRLRKMGYVKLINDQDFSYDAFVVYCESDENWVIHTLVAKLEIEGFRLCIPDREFDVGAVRCDQIVSAFNESKKIFSPTTSQKTNGVLANECS
ncbi:toll-like receptor 7 [Crassostrea virginica]